MRLMFGGESIGGYIDRFVARGMYGIAYDNTFSGVLAFLIFIAVIILAGIGLVQVIKWIIWGLPTKKK